MLVAETPRGGGNGDESLASPRGGGSGGASSSNVPPPPDEDLWEVAGALLVQFRLRDFHAEVFNDSLQVSIAKVKSLLANKVGLDVPVDRIHIYQYRLMAWVKIDDGEDIRPSDGSLAYEVMPKP